MSIILAPAPFCKKFVSQSHCPCTVRFSPKTIFSWCALGGDSDRIPKLEVFYYQMAAYQSEFIRIFFSCWHQKLNCTFYLNISRHCNLQKPLNWNLHNYLVTLKTIDIRIHIYYGRIHLLHLRTTGKLRTALPFTWDL